MDYYTITTPENIEIEYRLAGLGSRMAAVIIDFMVIGLLLAAVSIPVIVSSFKKGFENILSGNSHEWLIALYLILIFVITFGYFIITELIMHGQTPGKKLFRLRVIRENGQPLTLVQSLIRNLFRYFLDAYGIGVIVMLFSKKCKRVGDMAASTLVIAENPLNIKTENLTASSLLSSSSTIGNEKYTLSDEEYYLLKEYFIRKDSFLDKGEDAKTSLIIYFTNRFSLKENVITEDVLYKLLKLNSMR